MTEIQLEKLKPSIVRVCCSKMNNHTDGMEVAIDVICRLWKSDIHTNIPSYVNRVINSCVIDFMRGKSNSYANRVLPTDPHRMAELSGKPVAVSPKVSADQIDHAVWIEALINALPPQYKQPIALDLEGYSNRDIGEIIGLTEIQAKSLVWRGKKLIKQAIRDQCPEIYEKYKCDATKQSRQPSNLQPDGKSEIYNS